MSSLIPLYTPYSMKDILKYAQCKWDKNNRYWVANKRILREHPELQKYVNKPERVYFKIPYEIKDDFKTVGGQWDNDKRKWYLMSYEDIPQEYLEYKKTEMEDDEDE